MKKKLGLLALWVAALYGASYALFRASNSEIWEKDGRRYVIFPKEQVALYYVFRPIAYIDGAITGIGFHIGPHQ